MKFLNYIHSENATERLMARGPILGPGATAPLRVRAGRVSATDGPYAETKEQLGEGPSALRQLGSGLPAA